MAEILLTCNTQDFDVALCLKKSIQKELGIHVCVHLEDDETIYDEEFDAFIEQATVLLVLEFGDSNISAWVSIDGMDMSHSNYEETPFPEAIDFSEDFAEGLGILDNILYTDFGFDTKPAKKTFGPTQRMTQQPLTV